MAVQDPATYPTRRPNQGSLIGARDTFGDPEPAPAGAQVSSQGRQPLGNGRGFSTSPNGAKGAVPHRLSPPLVCRPSGAPRGTHVRSRGLRPWLLTSARSGLSPAESVTHPLDRTALNPASTGVTPMVSCPL